MPRVLRWNNGVVGEGEYKEAKDVMGERGAYATATKLVSEGTGAERTGGGDAAADVVPGARGEYGGCG